MSGMPTKGKYVEEREVHLRVAYASSITEEICGRFKRAIRVGRTQE